MDLTRVNGNIFRKIQPVGTVEIDGKVLTVYNPSDVDGKITVKPVCAPKTDFDRYYKDNLAYFNLFSGSVIREYKSLCERAIEKQKVEPQFVQVGKSMRAYAKYQIMFAVIAFFITVVLIKHMFNL